MYNIFTQYKSRLESQLNEHRNLNSQANYYAQQVSLALSGVNSIKNEVNSLSSQQGSLQAELRLRCSLSWLSNLDLYCVNILYN